MVGDLKIASHPQHRAVALDAWVHLHDSLPLEFHCRTSVTPGGFGQGQRWSVLGWFIDHFPSFYSLSVLYCLVFLCALFISKLLEG